MRCFIALFLSAFLFVGCIGLPSAAKLPTEPGGVSTIGQKLSAAIAGTPTHRAIQTFVNWQTTICILGGLACLAFGGLAIYGGQVLPGVKLVAAGLLLPIFGIWFAYHWLLVTILVLIGLAALLLVTHYALIQPALTAIEAWAKTVEVRLGVTTAAAPTAPAVAVASPVHPSATVAK